MIWFLGIIFFALLLTGIPVAFSLGLASLSYLVFSGNSLIIIPQRMFAGADSFSLMAIPFFVFAGEIMNRSGVTKRIVEFAASFVGFVSGGLAHATIVANIIMAGISGSTTADVAALGSMLIPSMVEAGYDRSYSTAVNAAGATIGSIIPPSILMILYGSITGISIGALFVSGFLPGLMVGFGFMIICYILAKRNPRLYNGESVKFSLKNFVISFLKAIPALTMPVIIVGGILSGVFTATEAGAIASVYGILVGVFLYKEIRLKDFPGLIIDSASVTGMAMLIVSSAILFSWILAIEGIPVMIAGFVTSLSSDPHVVLFIMILSMLIIGCFMDTTAAAIIMVPVYQPIAAMMGLNPIHFALVMVLTFIIGGVTPPVGITIYVATAVGKTKFGKVVHCIWPFLLVLLVVLLLVAYIPSISLFLPRLLGQV